MEKIILRNIKLPYDVSEKEAIAQALKKVRAAGIRVGSDRTVIHKRSIDARRDRTGARIKPSFIYSVMTEIDGAVDISKIQKLDAAYVKSEKPTRVHGNERSTSRPIVVGFGPCGMFAALMLAEEGYAPIVLERGADADERRAAVERFYRTRVLEESNIQFGAGGAGTFSDGKLVTRINDPKCAYVLEILHSLGAPDEILYDAKPHVGTDRLLNIVKNAAARIEELGGTIIYGAKVCDVKLSHDKVVSAVLEDRSEIECSSLVLAIGHSARDTYEMLFKRGCAMTAKPFSVGVRVEHLQSDIDRSLYGEFAGDDRLPVGEYTLSHRENGRAVYSFCMCPGGEVVAAASEDGGVVTNGMSRYARDGVNANAALAVSVTPEDYGNSVLDGVEFQRRLERAAYTFGGGGFTAPCECVGDFLSEKKSALSSPSKIVPTYMNANVRPIALDNVLPPYVCGMLRRGFDVFSRKMSAFADRSAVLTGVETRTSAPLRILRGEDMTSLNIRNLYPCGEGAGYAGGITSAAVDGINAALALMARYAPIE